MCATTLLRHNSKLIFKIDFYVIFLKVIPRYENIQHVQALDGAGK